jgi:hypothetical protein
MDDDQLKEKQEQELTIMTFHALGKMPEKMLLKKYIKQMQVN